MHDISVLKKNDLTPLHWDERSLYNLEQVSLPALPREAFPKYEAMCGPKLQSLILQDKRPRPDPVTTGSSTGRVPNTWLEAHQVLLANEAFGA